MTRLAVFEFMKPAPSSTPEAIRLAARLEGLLTDPVYEGKSMAGLIDLVVSGETDEHRRWRPDSAPHLLTSQGPGVASPPSDVL